MANFGDLPIELILMILNRLSPLDVDAFCQLTKRVREASHSFLEKHMALKSKYTTYRNFRDDGSENNGLLADLLKDILEDRRRALYCTRLYIYGHMGNFEDEAVADDLHTIRHTSYTEKTIKLFRDAISRCTMLPDNVKGAMINAMEVGDEDPLIALLLLLLPNLKGLRLVGCDAHFTTKLLEKVTEKEGTEILTQLLAVEINGCNPYVGTDYQGKDIGILNYFAVLPSVKRIIAFDAYGNTENEHPELQIMPRNRKSSVTHVAFARCSLRFAVLSEFLGNAETLESFSYYAGSPNLSGEEFQPMWFRAALLAHVSDTLEQLTILWCGEPKTSMGSLKNFKALRNLTTDFELLADLSSQKMFQLVPLLPQIIRSVILYEHCVSEPWHRLQILGELMVNKVEKVPELSSIAYNFYGDGRTCDHFNSGAHLKGDMSGDLATIGIQFNFTCNRQPYWLKMFDDEDVEEDEDENQDENEAFESTL